MKRRAAGIKGGTAEDARVQGWRAGAHALHLGHDLLVRLLERQVVAAAAAVVHRMPLVLHHLYRMTRCVNFLRFWRRGRQGQLGQGQLGQLAVPTLVVAYLGKLRVWEVAFSAEHGAGTERVRHGRAEMAGWAAVAWHYACSVCKRV